MDGYSPDGKPSLYETDSASPIFPFYRYETAGKAFPQYNSEVLETGKAFSPRRRKSVRNLLIWYAYAYIHVCTELEHHNVWGAVELDVEKYPILPARPAQVEPDQFRKVIRLFTKLSYSEKIVLSLPHMLSRTSTLERTVCPFKPWVVIPLACTTLRTPAVACLPADSEVGDSSHFTVKQAQLLYSHWLARQENRDRSLIIGAEILTLLQTRLREPGTQIYMDVDDLEPPGPQSDREGSAAPSISLNKHLGARTARSEFQFYFSDSNGGGKHALLSLSRRK